MKRGLASPPVHSALPTTRRGRLQLSSVDQRKSRKRRAGLPVRLALGARRPTARSSISLDQPGVAGEAEQEVDAVGLAPGHQRLAGKAAVGAQQDAHPRPAGADLADDARDLLDRAGRGVDVGAAQLGRQQMPAAEDVERQVAVAVVIAVEEAAFLVAVQRIVGGVEIEDDLRRRLAVRIEEQIDEQRLDRRRCRGRSCGSASASGAAQFQPVQRALAGQRRAVRAPRRELAGQHRQHRVVAQLVVVDQVLVAQRDAEHALHRPASRPRARSAPATAPSVKQAAEAARSGRSPGRSRRAAARRHPR